MNVQKSLTVKVFLIAIVLFSCENKLFSQWKRLLDAPTYGFSVNPKNPNNIYVGGLGRKLYRTDNGGKTWDTLIVEFETGTARFTNVLVSREDTSVIVVAGLGFGTVRRSSDRGETWQTVIETLSPFFAPGELIYEIPGKENHMIIGELASRKIYQSTNKGATWDSISTVLPESGYFLCTLTPRNDSNNIIYGGCTPGSIVRSTDNGKTWKQISKLIENKFNDSEVPKIIVSKRDPSIMYAVITYFYPESKPNGGVFKSDDYGFSWKRIGYRDTCLWAIDSRPYNNNTDDELWIGGLFDGLPGDDGLPGRGVIGHSISTGNVWELEKNIPWNSDIAQNVWMLRFEKDKIGNDVVYFATQEGFLSYEYPTTSVTSDDFLHHYDKPIPKFNSGYLAIQDLNIEGNDLFDVSIYSLIGERVFYSENISSDELLAGISVNTVSNVNILVIRNSKKEPVLFTKFVN